jgi:hypothetical protein
VGPNHKSNGLKGQPSGPTPWPAGHTLSQIRLRLGVYVHMLAHKRILCPRVSGNRDEWMADHVDLL